MSDLITAIEEKLLNSNRILGQVSQRVLSARGKITYFNSDRYTADVAFQHPIFGSISKSYNVPFQMARGQVSGVLMEGDEVMLAFPSGSTAEPLIVSAYKISEPVINGAEYSSSLFAR